MSFQARDLSVLAYANGFTHWHYRTADLLAELLAGYFGGAAELLRPGDQITVTLLGDDRADLASLAVISLPEGRAPEIAFIAGSARPLSLARAA